MHLVLLLLLTGEPLKGFQKTEWGMAEGAVEKLYPGGTWARAKTSSQYTASVAFAGFPSSVVFRFNAKGLRAANVELKNYAERKQTCAALGTALAERYGAPEKREDRGEGDTASFWSSDSTVLVLTCLMFPAAHLEAGVRLGYRAQDEPVPPVKKEDL